MKDFQAFEKAIQEGNPDELKRVLAAAATSNEKWELLAHRDPQWQTYFKIAAKGANAEIIQILIEEIMAAEVSDKAKFSVFQDRNDDDDSPWELLRENSTIAPLLCSALCELSLSYYSNMSNEDVLELLTHKLYECRDKTELSSLLSEFSEQPAFKCFLKELVCRGVELSNEMILIDYFNIEAFKERQQEKPLFTREALEEAGVPNVLIDIVIEYIEYKPKSYKKSSLNLSSSSSSSSLSSTSSSSSSLTPVFSTATCLTSSTTTTTSSGADSNLTAASSSSLLNNYTPLFSTGTYLTTSTTTTTTSRAGSYRTTYDSDDEKQESKRP